ncbi:MAG: VIT1/CCC1 transporter family protein [Candidatus Micrarchaeota archaeon]
MTSLTDLLKNAPKWRKYWRITKAGEIARRAFSTNSFDGLLTTIGVLTGLLAAGVTDARIITSTCIATAIAIGLSGFSGSFITEAAERKKKLIELERAMMRKLSNTEIERASEFATIIIAIIDGASPLIASLIIVTPFFLLPATTAYYYSFIIAGIALIALGLFLGKISKENKLLTGFKMLLAGILAAGISFILLN